MNSLLIYHKKNLNDYTRLGIAVSKKIGKANIRNRYKRIIKEYFRKSEFKELSLDVLVVMNPKRYKQLSTSEIEFEHIMLNDLESSFKKIVQDHVNL
jgi:ribonuclease P protein component